MCQRFHATEEDKGKRLDQFLAFHLPDVSRVRVQLLIEQEKVAVDGKSAKSSLKLRGSELVEVTGEAAIPPLRAMAEDIPLDIVYEDDAFAVINKPAGMMVHAGAGDEDRNRGTLVNAMLYHFKSLSGVSGELRPGIVHRLDKDTSGLILVAKSDKVHRKLAELFSQRQVKKKYLALVHGWLKEDSGTVNAEISRDRLRRTRMTTRRAEGRTAISHYRVVRRIDSEYGKFSLVEVRIETGRTHQIRVHLSSIGHPVVGDALYGAPREIRHIKNKSLPPLNLGRNFLHAAQLSFVHPLSGESVTFDRPLPADLETFVSNLA